MCGSGNAVNKKKAPIAPKRTRLKKKKSYEEQNDPQCSGVRKQFPSLQLGDRGSCAAWAEHLSPALKISL